MNNPNNLSKWLIVAALAASATTLAACGSDDTDDTNPTDDTGMDAGDGSGMDDGGGTDGGGTDGGGTDGGGTDGGGTDGGGTDGGGTDGGGTDTGGPLEGACLNETDGAIIAGGTVTDEAQTCGLGCLGAADPGACAEECVVEATGLSNACAGCYSGVVVCSIENCLAACAADPDSEACGTCQAENCLPDFYTCTGIEPETSNTIVDVAAAAGTFTTLLAAAEAAGLVETLSGDGPLTVFAPTDDAFAALPEGTVEALLADPDALREILLYHVVEGAVPASAVTTGPVTTVSGFSAWTSVGETVTINDATITATDIAADNGIIHVIDTVILPPNIVEFASYTGEFDTLLAAATAADLDGLLTSEGPFTVFAPTDAAFDLLEEGTVDSLLADIPALTAILTYHAIVGTAVPAADVEPGFIATASSGLNAAIHVDSADALSINNANIVITDIVTTNGIIHVIDEVIQPATIGELASYADGFSTLYTAVTAADASVASALTDASGTFTVFAPTNEAFAAVPAETLSGLLADAPALTEVLFYHVLGSEVLAAEVTAGFATSAADLSFYIGTDGGVTVNQANVIATDVLATNGVIHAIDAVILPSDLATLVGYDPELATLGVAVGAADPSVAAALTDATASYTLFAPVNAAFEAIDPALLAAVLADPVTLTDILLYHVFDGAVDAAAAIAAVGTSIDMVNGDAAAVTAAGDSLLIDGATVLVTDINATNGIIHKIGAVMLP